MLIITTIEMLHMIDDADIKYIKGLTAKDRIVVLSKEGATMPVALFQTLSSLKSPLEIKEVDTKDAFKLGYVIGALASGVKPTEKVLILYNKQLDDLCASNVVWSEKLSSGKSGKAKSTVKAVVTAAKKATSNTAGKASVKVSVEPGTRTSTKTSAKTENRTESKTAAKATAKSAVKTTAKKETKALPKIRNVEQLVSALPKLKKYKKQLIDNEESFKEAIFTSSDAEIGLKFQLEIRFGLKDGGEIWEIIKEHYEALKKSMA